MSKPYFEWQKKIITDFAPNNIEVLYANGFVFTRIGKGVMSQTRSFRINLKNFELTSENRRILRKAADYKMEVLDLPMADYNWNIGKMAKDFYEKFGDSVFSANKIKEILTDADKSNFNKLLVFSARTEPFLGSQGSVRDFRFGHAICRETPNILHYSYPFYLENENEPSRGLCMMTMAIAWAKENNKQYVYLGSLQRPSDTYKLQFEGAEWFDGKNWQNDTASIKEILKK